MDQCLKNTTEPRYPKFQDYEIRFLSFNNWNNTKNPHDLVKSGFSFIGGKDNVQCFHCGIIINNWDRADDVDFCHRTSSPDCAFIKLKSYHLDQSAVETFSNILAQLRSIKDTICEIRHLLRSENCESEEYKLFEGITLPKF